jgi:hypothetical protein
VIEGNVLRHDDDKVLIGVAAPVLRRPAIAGQARCTQANPRPCSFSLLADRMTMLDPQGARQRSGRRWIGRDVAAGRAWAPAFLWPPAGDAVVSAPP